MPRPTPNRTRLPVSPAPERYNRHYARAFASLLGRGDLAFECIETIVELVHAHRTSVAAIKGHSPPRTAAALATVERRLDHGDDSSKAVMEIADAWFGNADVETYERLADLLDNPAVPPWAKAEVVRTRRLEVERLPRIDAHHGLMVITSIFALLIWQRWSARRDNRNLQWRFVLGVLDAAGVGTEGFRVNPVRLKRELDRMLALTAAPLPWGNDVEGE
jgi:hypothetical protein